MALSLQRRNRLGENVRQIRLFAKYSIPLVWGIVGLVVGCVGAYFVLAFVWTHAIMRPEAVTSGGRPHRDHSLAGHRCFRRLRLPVCFRANAVAHSEIRPFKCRSRRVDKAQGGLAQMKVLVCGECPDSLTTVAQSLNRLLLPADAPGRFHSHAFTGFCLRPT